ncbi:MAG: serine/threonine protein kinase [Planctomycetes bacterium]|nr:serine/threonine protein kinase [Planctomycetota bacterium]
MSEHLKPGSVVFGYVIERLLGRGGMGTVYLARQQSLNRAVALKILHPHQLRNPAAVEDFLREARATARLNHQHLVTCHDAQADPDKQLYCYSMEYIPGLTVAATMQAEGPMKRSMALHITYQIASALGYAHQHSLVHRDVKPDNIMVNKNGVAKLLDLGLVRDRLDGVGSTSAGKKLMIVGTPEFSAPEQSRNPRLATPASDVYSLGATLYYMLSGRPPHTGETIIDLIVRAATEQVYFPESIPVDCRDLLLLMLARSPDERLPHGAAVVAALEALAQGRAPKLPEKRLQTETSPAEDMVEDEPAGSGASQRRRVRRVRRHR